MMSNEIAFFKPITDENTRVLNQNGLFSSSESGLELESWKMDGSKKFCVATIKLNEEQFDIEGFRNEETWVFLENYDQSKTEKLIQKLREDIRVIDKKLLIKGHFFSDEIGYYDVPPEVIKELLNRCFNKTIDCGIYVNDISRVIFFDIACKNYEGIHFNPENKFNEHFKLKIIN